MLRTRLLLVSDPAWDDPAIAAIFHYAFDFLRGLYPPIFDMDSYSRDDIVRFYDELLHRLESGSAAALTWGVPMATTAGVIPALGAAAGAMPTTTAPETKLTSTTASGTSNPDSVSEGACHGRYSSWERVLDYGRRDRAHLDYSH